MRKWGVGSQVFLASCTWRLALGDRSLTQFLSPHSTDSHPLSNLFVTLFALSSPHIFDLILSFPHLEDLTVTIHHRALAYNDEGSDWLPTATQSSSPPMFTGSLKLLSWAGAQHIVHWLLSLPGGIRFRKLIGRWSRGEELLLMMALVERCSHTLESLDITRGRLSKSIQHLRPHKIVHNCL